MKGGHTRVLKRMNDPFGLPNTRENSTHIYIFLPSPEFSQSNNFMNHALGKTVILVFTPIDINRDAYLRLDSGVHCRVSEYLRSWWD